MMSQSSNESDVRVEVTVEAPVERAFQVFTADFDTWWPRSHHLGAAELGSAVLEPVVGGRWYERTADGEECDWGRVLAWDPPSHVGMTWEITTGFVGTSPENASRIDVWFEAVDAARTSVTLVHSEFERHGEDWESTRKSVDGEGGWPDILAGFAEAVSV